MREGPHDVRLKTVPAAPRDAGAEGGPPEARRPAPPAGPGPATRAPGPAPAGPPAPAHRWTLSQRLALVYGAVSLVILLGAAAFTWWQASTIEARKEDLAIAEVRRISDRVGASLAQARQGASVLAASDPEARGFEPCQSLLNAAHLTMDAIVLHLYAVDANRRIVCSTQPDAIGRESTAPIVRTIELTGRPVTGALNDPGNGLGRIIAVGHPVRRNGLQAGVVIAVVSVAELRSTTRYLPEMAGLRIWMLDSAGASTSLVGAEEPMPDLPPALHASFLAPQPVDAGVATANGQILIETRATEDIALIATVPEHALRAAAPLEVALPPLLLAAVLLGGMGALFWSVQRFVVAPLEAATRRLEGDDATPPPERDESGAADVADLIRRLGATRATRDEAIRLRDMLLREAHHRIKNHLSLVASFLRLQERQLSDHAALQALRAAQGRMVAIGMTYELLHDGAGQFVALDQMLERFARALAARDLAEGNATRVVTDLRPMEAPADIAVKVALVVNELATNALKYAFAGRGPGTVRITLRPEEGGGFALVVADDGNGMPSAPRRGLGMTVVDSLVRGIDARLERLSGPGTAFRIAWAPHAEPPRRA